MSRKHLIYVNRSKAEYTGETNTIVPSNENVPPEERRKAILKFVNQQDIALPPLAIFAGLKRQENIHFSYRTVQNALSDLVEQELMMRVDTEKLREGEGIQPVDGGGGRRSYYFVTEKGRSELAD